MPDGKDGRGVKAHRFFYENLVGPIPAGMVVRHKCDTPACVNPGHLEIGTAADNVRDMVQRGRLKGAAGRCGVHNINGRLTEAEVEAIRAFVGNHAQAARAFGISRTHAWQIRRGLTRAHAAARLSMAA